MNPSKHRGLFITLEGTEGVGKSTLAKALVEALKTSFPSMPEPLLTREPGGGVLAEMIRPILLSQEMPPWSEVFLYQASRADHVQNKILPALNQGRIVICDRYTDSTLAYQGAARGLDWNTLKRLNDLATEKLKPDLTVWLDIPVQLALERAKDPNRFEREGLSFHKKVYKGFSKIQKENPKRFFKLKCDKKSPDELARIVLAQIEKKLKRGTR